MEFSFEVGKILPGRITILEKGNDESDVKIYDLNSKAEEKPDSNCWIYHLSANPPWDIKLRKKKEELTTVIDEMGIASAKAQSLRTPITTFKKLLNSSQQKIYFVTDDKNNKSVIGFLKVGVKRLFVCDDAGAHHELDPLCVLDFYVHETKQRCGFGHELFDVMLQHENIVPDKLAIDRPSFKFLSFLRKHYGLKNHIVQSNNFVIYPSFFLNREVTRPPIFLYNGKAMQPVISNISKRQFSRRGSYANEAEALNSIKVSLCSSELKKNNAYYSSAAKCLMWDDEEKVTVGQKKQFHRSHSSVQSNSNKSTGNINNGNWNGHSAVQSCSNAHKKVDGWSSSRSTPGSLTPVNTVSNYSRMRWDQMQSSWNIFGVKPMDYTLYQQQN